MSMNKEIKKMGFGLKLTPPDSRDFNLGKMFGAISLSEVPLTDFIIAEPLEIKDQKNTDFCAGFAVAAVSEDQEKVLLDPLYIFAKGKQLQGEFESWGIDLRTICKVLTKFGSLSEKDTPYTIDMDRDEIANWEGWPQELDKLAKIHSKRSYFKISSSGYPDMFDALRAYLWQHRDDKCSILTGVTWKREWTGAKKGIIPKKEGTPAFGHAFKIYGQKVIDGELYLVAQLSNGTKIGNKGIFYFPKEIINREFTYGSYMFRDISPEEVKKIHWTLWQKIINWFKKLLE